MDNRNNNHDYYDGPAFFRNQKYSDDSLKFKLAKQKRIREQEKQKYEKTSQEQASDVFQMRKEPASEEKLAKNSYDFESFSPHTKATDNVDLENNPLARIVANFHPKHLYLKNGVKANPFLTKQPSGNSAEVTQRSNGQNQQLGQKSNSANEFTTVTTEPQQNSELNPFNSDQKQNLEMNKTDESSDNEEGTSNDNLDTADNTQDTQTVEPNNVPSDTIDNTQDTQTIDSSNTLSNDINSVNKDSNNPNNNQQAVENEDNAVNNETVDDSSVTQSSNLANEVNSQEINQDTQNNNQPNNAPEVNSDAGSVPERETQQTSSESNFNTDDGIPSLPKHKKTVSGNLFSIMKDKKQHQTQQVESQKQHDQEVAQKQRAKDLAMSNQQKNNNDQGNVLQMQQDTVRTSGNQDRMKWHNSLKGYKFPNLNLLKPPYQAKDKGLSNWILKKAEVLNKTLKAFNVQARVVNWTNGPTVTQYQVKLHLGVKVSKIRHLADDLKMALAAKDIRIEAPIPGKTTCGIEIPNPQPRPVTLSEVLDSKEFQQAKSPLTIALGVDLQGHPRIANLGKMPHGLIAGATGSGKSVFINCMLMSLLYKATPEQVRLILIDPKAVELAPYNGIPHLITPVISKPKQAAESLKWAAKVMDQRYIKLAAAHVRNIGQFNKKADEYHRPDLKMPYIVIVIDELADLMMVAGDAIESYIVRITQKARAAGIHLIVATQRPSVDVITGTMKNNIPTRIAFMVSSQVDSRTIIDQSGAERLLGKGDMLYLGSGNSHPIRLQGCFVGNHEIDRVVKSVRKQASSHYDFQPGKLLHHAKKIANQDKLLPRVIRYIVGQKSVSISKLQRVFSIGYNRSAKIIADLEKHNYIGAQHGSKPRDVYLTPKEYKKLNL